MRPKIVLVARLGILLAIATCTEPQEPTVPRPIGGATADVVGSDPVFVGAGDIAECDRHSYDTIRCCRESPERCLRSATTLTPTAPTPTSRTATTRPGGGKRRAPILPSAITSTTSATRTGTSTISGRRSGTRTVTTATTSAPGTSS